jgi:alpha-D-ribose 1-methylphosphonate 5-triphosphate diphosphatase
VTGPTTTLRGGRLVLPDRVEDADLALEDGRIAVIAARLAPASRDLDARGRLVLPGFLDLHGDALEKEAEPRPGAFLPPGFAVAQADRRCALAGVTTVCHAIAFASGELGLRAPERACALALAVLEPEAPPLVRHHLHLRYEITDPLAAPVVAELLERGAAVLSFMDHTPGQGQFRDLAAYAAYLARTYGTAAEEVARRVEAKRSEAASALARVEALARRARARGVLLASHDDDCPERVAALAARGVRASEFPVRLDAARAAAGHGLAVIVGAPNLYRGGSQSGGLAARAAIAAGLARCLCSDYAPQTLLPAVLRAAREGLLDLPEAVALATRHPADLLGRPDLGRIAPGATADLLLVRADPDPPAVELTLLAGEPVLRATPGRSRRL